MSNYQGQSQNSGDFLKVLLALKANIMRDLKVASLAQIKSIKDDIYTVMTFPQLEKEADKNIECVSLENLSLHEQDVVLIVYTDRNFLQNLKQVKLRQKLTPLKSDIELHSDKFGVIVGRIYKFE